MLAGLGTHVEHMQGWSSKAVYILGYYCFAVDVDEDEETALPFLLFYPRSRLLIGVSKAKPRPLIYFTRVPFLFALPDR